MIVPPEVLVQLAEWDALDPAPADACSLEHEVELGELGVSGQPCVRSGVDAPHLLLVDHLERVPVAGTSLLLYLDHDEAAAAPQHEIELVATNARVGVEKSVSAKSVVTESAPFAAIHAVEGLAERASSVGFRWSLRGKDAKSAPTGRMGATEDARSTRPAQLTGTNSVSPGPPV